MSMWIREEVISSSSVSYLCLSLCLPLIWGKEAVKKFVVPTHYVTVHRLCSMIFQSRWLSSRFGGKEVNPGLYPSSLLKLWVLF
jgi:hypothetical protein